MSQYFEPPKIRNIISFGKRKQPDTSHKQYRSNKESLNVRLQDSCQFDFGKQISELGLQIVNSSEKSIQNSCHFNFNHNILFEKIKGFVMNVRQKIFKLKQDVNTLRRTQEQFFNMFNINKIIQEMKSKKITLIDEGTDNCSQSLLYSSRESDRLGYIKKVLQSTSFSLQFKNQIPNSESLLREIQILKNQKQIQNKQIELLKKQIQSLKKLEQKKHHYYTEKLKLKQLQWERKLNQILKEYNSVTDNKQVSNLKANFLQRQKQFEPRMRTITQNSQLYPRRRQCSNQKYRIQNHSAYYTLNNSKQKNSRKNSRRITQNSYYLINPAESQFQTSIEGTKQLYQKLKLLQKRCRMSNDSSLTKASEKIKALEENVRKQIHNMKKS